MYAYSLSFGCLLNTFYLAQVAVSELRLLRTLERVESLENVAKWSYRQPKKQRNLGGMTKTHWDYLLDEIVRNLIPLALLYFALARFYYE